MAKRTQQPTRLTVERLEGREIPSVSPWRTETFDQTAIGAVPDGWIVHNAGGDGGIASGASQTLGAGASLQSLGGSTTETRAWSDVLIPADARVSASIFIDSLVPAQIIARGQNLDSDTPTYYAVSVTRGLEVQLLKIVDGQRTVLASMNSSSWISNQWVRLSLTTVGNDLHVQVFRADTAQYLNANGQWQVAQTQAMNVTDATITGAGYAGIARAAKHSGQVNFENFATSPPPLSLTTTVHGEESFTRPQPGGLPAGWSQWGIPGTALRVSTAASLTESAGLRTISAGPGAIRSWLDQVQPRDVDVSASVFLDGLAPAEIIARGKNLAGDMPTYYAATVTRGVELQLVRVIDGEKTVLATLTSKQWLSGQWVQVTVSAVGDDLRAMVYRTDTAQYLDAAGNWQANETWAIQVNDDAIGTGGLTGLGRAGGIAGIVTFDSFAVTQPVPRLDPSVSEDFDDAPVGTLPPGWSQWQNLPAPGFQVGDQPYFSSPGGLISDGGSDLEARVWLDSIVAADVQASASMYLDSLVPAQLFVRGRDLNTASPTYYAVSVTRGLEAQILRVENGQTTVLSTIASTAGSWDSHLWVRVTLTAQGDTLQLQVVRLDSGKYLDQDGEWSSEPAIAASVNDSAIDGAGVVGLARPASYSGRLAFDDFAARGIPLGPTTTPPIDTPPAPTPTGDGTTPDAPPVVTPPPSTPPVVTPPTTTPPVVTPPTTTPPTTTPPGNDPPTTTPPGNDPPTTPPSTNPPPVSEQPANLPSVPRHYAHIRVAQFAYHGTPFASFEQNLLKNSIDLVIPNTAYLERIADIAGSTPQFLYSNASNLYRELLTDWLEFADRKGYDREAAFYHATQSQQFTGDSASSWPVVWFWNVLSGKDGDYKRVTSQARSGSDELTFGGLGESVLIGNTEKFREINFNLSKGARAGWNGVLEYATAVDASGKPTAWKTLTTIDDGTANMTKSGQITFDPPKDWATANPGGNARLYYVRVRTTAVGDAPVARTILGRDYVNANGTAKGVIPAFDKSADKDGDGYLSDTEYAGRKSGMDARFVYETRVFYPAYGQNRFATNVGNALFKEWAADYSYRFLEAHPQAKGLFMDNSLSKIAFDPKTIAESLDHYAENYAEVLAGINARINPKWVLANVAGGGVTVDALAKRGISYLDEFVIRPMAASYSQFEDVAANLKRRLDLSNGKGYAILDSLATGSTMTDPRVQIGTLAYYYLLADPHQTMLIFNGGNDPNSSWTKHWSEAVKFNVGQALEEWSVLTKGTDPADSSKTYKVYQREYENALVLYKPLSYYRGVAGSTADTTATTHNLDGKYRPLNADGTLGAPINRITLRNGEGAILVKV